MCAWTETRRFSSRERLCRRTLYFPGVRPSSGSVVPDRTADVTIILTKKIQRRLGSTPPPLPLSFNFDNALGGIRGLYFIYERRQTRCFERRIIFPRVRNVTRIADIRSLVFRRAETHKIIFFFFFDLANSEITFENAPNERKNIQSKMCPMNGRIRACNIIVFNVPVTNVPIDFHPTNAIFNCFLEESHVFDGDKTRVEIRLEYVLKIQTIGNGPKSHTFRRLNVKFHPPLSNLVVLWIYGREFGLSLFCALRLNPRNGRLESGIRVTKKKKKHRECNVQGCLFF